MDSIKALIQAPKWTCAPNPPAPWESTFAGFIAGMSSVVTTFPIQKGMTRQMLTGATTFASFKQYLSEGPRHFLRGVVPALCIKGISGANLYGSNDVVKLRVKDLKFSETTNQVLGSVLAGTYSGSTDCLLFGPFERIQTLLLDQRRNEDRNLSSTYTTARHLLKHHGVTELYRGSSIMVTRNVTTGIIYLYVMDEIHKKPKPTSPTALFLYNFVTGGLVGGINSSIFFPLNVIKTKVQSDAIGGQGPAYRRTFQELVKERGGLRGLYRGVHLNLIRSSISWGIISSVQQAVFKRIHKLRCPDEPEAEPTSGA